MALDFLAFIFNQSMEHGYLPPTWLQAFITPIYQKGDTTDPNNYIDTQL